MLLALIPGCFSRGEIGLVDEPGPGGTGTAAAPLVVLLRYGGVAGSSDRVSVDALGVATVVSDRAPSASTRILSSGDLAVLRTSLERAEIATLLRNYLDTRRATPTSTT